MRLLSRVRFNSLAGYARGPMAVFFAEEVAWFERCSERVLGAVLRDRTDNDFTGMVMARTSVAGSAPATLRAPPS